MKMGVICKTCNDPIAVIINGKKIMMGYKLIDGDYYHLKCAPQKYDYSSSQMIINARSCLDHATAIGFQLGHLRSSMYNKHVRGRAFVDKWTRQIDKIKEEMQFIMSEIKNGTLK